ncbi:MAG: MBL fold metallo-hydrolase [Acutalibacteraceae bacterium]
MNNVEEIKYGNTKCYLIDRKVLIDTDWAGSLQNFFKCIKQKKILISDIKYLIITHFHPDHMGIAQELSELGINIVVLEEQKDYIHFSDKIFEKEKNTTFKPIEENRIMTISCSESRHFFENIGIHGEIIHTPGHSEDSISILLDNGIAIVGDLYPLYSVPAYNNKVLEQSWNEILSHDIHLIYYGHAKEDFIENINSLNDIL